MTHHRAHLRKWRLRTVAFGFFAGLAIFLLENLIDPFLPKDSNNSQLWGNTIVAAVSGCLGLFFMTYLVIRSLRQGLFEKGPKQGEFSINGIVQYWIAYVLGAVLMIGLIFLTA